MISIVTPSLNQGPFVEAAIRSVLAQGVDIEYVVVDGGSTDGSVATIERYADRLAAWRSEPDAGQYDAINKGFALTSGEIMGWLNADDFYVAGCLSTVHEVFERYPEIEWLTSTLALTANERGQLVRVLDVGRFSRAAFLRGFNLPAPGRHAGHFLPQEATFWRRSLWERAGGRVDASLALAGDFDLWARFYDRAELWGVRALLAAYRVQPAQKTAVAFASYLAEAERVLARHGGRRYAGVEGSFRSQLSRRVGTNALWRLPSGARTFLERRRFVHSAHELVWSARDGDWVVNTEYFV